MQIYKPWFLPTPFLNWFDEAYIIIIILLIFIFSFIHLFIWNTFQLTVLLACFSFLQYLFGEISDFSAAKGSTMFTSFSLTLSAEVCVFFFFVKTAACCWWQLWEGTTNVTSLKPNQTKELKDFSASVVSSSQQQSLHIKHLHLSPDKAALSKNSFTLYKVQITALRSHTDNQWSQCFILTAGNLSNEKEEEE